MRYFLPGKEGFPWLAGVAACGISAVFVFGYFFPTQNAPEAAPAAVAATPAPSAPPVVAAIPSSKPVHTESIVDISSRFAPVETSPPATPVGASQVIPEGPAAASPLDPLRCARYAKRMPPVKRESIFDDIEAKYEANQTSGNRRFAQIEKCLRQVAPNKGG
jgi:hypothetical protein